MSEWIFRDPRGVSKRTRAALVVACGVALLGISWLDQLVSREISLSLFYLFPVATAAWYAGRKAGLVLALAGAALWGYSDVTTGAPFSHWAIPHWNSLVRLIYFATVAHLLSRLQELLARERDGADIDMLTGVLSRAGWYELAAVELARARKNVLPLAVAYIDLDDFKHVNDTHGHAAGDRVLQTVAATLRASVRRGDFVGRLGGDEFVILFPGAIPSEAHRVCSKVQTALNAAMDDLRFPVGCSVGIAAFETPPKTVQDLVSPADAAMYTAKRGGKNAIAQTRFD